MIHPHEYYMKIALNLAKKGMGFVSPNPCVGAIVVDRLGNIISKGYHRYYGGPHAEVYALEHLDKKQAKDATLYVTLEPCNHFGKTPPCTELIIKKGIRKVVVGLLDPNPIVNGAGIKRLKESGIAVTTGVLENLLAKFYKPFNKYITKKIPFITLKVAQSLDGKNAVKSGNKYLVSEKTLKFVHRLRFESDAIMVGINTILTDNPKLNIRYGNKKPLLKVVLDTNGRIPENAEVYNTKGKVLIYTANKKIKKKHDNEEICYVDKVGNYCNILQVLNDLGNRGIQNLLVEGGGTLSFELIKNKLLDRLVLIITPYIIGGSDFLSFKGEGFSSLKESLKIKDYSLKKIDKDLILISDLI
jgi:diaminohydroxyphosphoribosylaminopyrimidine deaminase/5-amino-6-(5-phosphoribosylamino)uracil reductase